MARRQVSIFINGREIANQMKALRDEKRKVTRELNNMVIGTEEYHEKMKELDQLNGIITKHNNKIRGVESSWTKMTTSALKFGAVAAAGLVARAVAEYGTELFDLGSQMEVLDKKAKTVFGDTFGFVESQAKKNAAAMGLTTQQYINASASIGDLLIPMGFQREEAANISTEMTNLSGALSEWTGGQIEAEQVTKILGKAVLGEREELKQLGISISEADVKTRLAEKGLSELTGEMLQQAKAAATLELITEKSADAQAAYANNSDTLVRKQAELNAKFQDIKSSLAQALVPVFHRLLEVATPIVTTISDLVISLINGTEATGKFSGVTNILATIITNAFKATKLLYGVLVGVGSYLFDALSPALEWVGLQFLQFYNVVVDGVNGLQEFVGIDVGELKPIDIEAFKQSIADAKASIDDAGLEQDIEVSTSAAGAGTNDAQVPTNITGGSGGEDKEAIALQKKLERLREIEQGFREQNRIDALNEEDQKIAQLEAKYNEQIEKAKELEAKAVSDSTAVRLELERQKQIAVDELRAELDQAAFDEKMLREQELTDLEIEANLARIEEQAAIEKEFRDFLKGEQEASIEEARQLEIEALEIQFQQLLALAEKYGLDTEALKTAHRKRLKGINDKFNKDDLTEQKKAEIARLKALAKSYGDAASIISSTLDTLASLGVKNAGLQKALALAEIGFNTAKAIANGIANAMALPFPGNVAAVATTIATVVANMATASKILSGTNVPQKKKGSWHNVTGQDDNVTYRAKYIGSPTSGMLPSHPVVLASEAGAEYFVSNRDLQDPYVLNHVQAIENIRKNRLPQYVDGGLSDGELPSTASVANGLSDEVGTFTLEVLTQLVAILDRGVMAYIEDDTVISIRQRFNELNAASGGTLE